MRLATIRQHYQQGLQSVARLIESFEMQIEQLTLNQNSDLHTICLENTVKNQVGEIKRLNQVIENKAQQILEAQRAGQRRQEQFALRLLKEKQINQELQQQLQTGISPSQRLIDRLENQIKKLQLHLSDASQLNLKLQSKIRDLEKCLESDNPPAIVLDSHNSSLPPSSDAPWNKLPQTRSLRHKSGLRAEGQTGHQGSTLLQVRRPDLVIVHQVDACQSCHYSLIQTESIRFHKRQIFEIENGKLTVIEHRAEVKICPACGQVAKGSFPDSLKAPVQYGASVLARLVYLNQYQLLPVARTAETMHDLFECPVSWATIQKAARVCSGKLLKFEYQTKAALRRSEVLGVDETCININGENNWVHLARTDELTHLAFHPKRGGTAFDEIGIINRFKGTLVRDCFSAYRRYEQCRHSFCNAHLLRNLTFVGENEPEHRAWTEQFARLLVKIKAAVGRAKLDSRTALSPSQQSYFYGRYHKLLAEAERAIRGSPKSKFIHLSAISLYRRFLMNKHSILRFMTDFSVPFDNNGSERDLRMLKLQQKISGCFRSAAGASVFCRVRSFLSSARKQGRNLLTVLESVTSGRPIVSTG